ncbi:MAG: hypothetical protein ABIZ81_17055 [Opitutaceae bacterium]
MKISTLRRGATTSILVLAAGLAPFTASAKNSRSRPPQLISMFARDGAAQEITTEALSATPDAWQNIQYHSYEKRQEFTAVFARMVAKLDGDIVALNEKRATMKNDARDWDFAMKELNNARANVQSKVTDLSKANTAEIWTDARDKLGVAWDRAQSAVEAVRKSTTS